MDSPGSMILLPLGLRGWFFNVLTATEHIVSMWVLPVGIFFEIVGSAWPPSIFVGSRDGFNG